MASVYKKAIKSLALDAPTRTSWSVAAATTSTLVLLSNVVGQTLSMRPIGQQMPSIPCMTYTPSFEGQGTPCALDVQTQWLESARHYREERLIRIGYDGFLYSRPEFQWIQSSFMQAQVMVQDRFLYDPVAQQYTVDRYLGDLQQRYGGVDAVLIWPTYPNLGIDDRNQQDVIQSMPGGIQGVKKLVTEFHRHNVRVLFPMMLWDQGTRDPGKPWPEAVASLLKEVGADGLNGDTQDGIPLAFFVASEKANHPLVLEPELSPSDEAVAWNLMTWGQYKFPFAPEVDRYKWLESRHMVHISDRWSRDKTDDLQFAFFNGVGWESWENIWSIWNGITPRDGEATKRIAAIERAIATMLSSPGWEPYAPMHEYGVFASRWPFGEEVVWTIVNRNEYDIEGAQMSVPHQAGRRYFDLYHGVELTPALKDEPFFMGEYPVTNSEFKVFLHSAHYVPKDDANFLRDWKNGSFPMGWENRPVTWVALEDARAYAHWAGKRLPHEWEWQFAAQGLDNRLYPWGNEWRLDAVPAVDRTRILTSPDDVGAHPNGASAAGVSDLVGNVWQWTDEYEDERTRSAILRGGSYFQPQGSVWYFPQAYRNNQHSKLLLMAPSLDRSGTIGFRCVADAEP